VLLASPLISATLACVTTPVPPPVAYPVSQPVAPTQQVLLDLDPNRTSTLLALQVMNTLYYWRVGSGPISGKSQG
jgi:hypothetical protein